MKYILCILIFSTLFFISCKNKNNEKVHFLNTSPLGIDLAKKKGFKKVKGIDLLVLNKQINDTLISLEYDNISNKNYLKTWKVELGFSDINKVKNVLLDYELIPLTENNYWDNNKGYTVAVIRNVDNNVFICDVGKENDKLHLNISYNIPK